METMPHAVHTSRDMATDPVLSRRPHTTTVIVAWLSVPVLFEQVVEV